MHLFEGLLQRHRKGDKRVAKQLRAAADSILEHAVFKNTPAL